MKRTKGKQAEPEQEKPERKQVGIHVDTKLWRKFRAKAVEQDVQAGHLVEELIREYLKKQS
jgi:uncharacterized protein (DUF4415 family)